jgi:cell division protein FtsB
MPTRLKRPSIWRALGVTVVLLAFQGYLGYSALRGQFGIDSQKEMVGHIEDLRAQSARLKAEIDVYRHRVDLFSPQKLDTDILTERARAAGHGRSQGSDRHGRSGYGFAGFQFRRAVS